MKPMLQWGRARVSAEMRQTRNNEYANIYFLASMGPRSCERGNLLVPRGRTAGRCGFNGAALV